MTIFSKASIPLHEIKEQPKPASSIFLNFTNTNTVDQRQIINQGLHCLNCYSQKVIQLIRNSNICDGLSFFNPKGFYCSYAWFCSSHEVHSSQHLSQKNSTDSYLCFWLALIHSVSCFFFHYQSPYWSLCTVFDSISSASDSPALLALFLSSEASICSTWFSLHLEIQMMLLPQFPMTFHQTQNEIPCFTV